MESFAPWDDTLALLVFAAINALISPVLTYGLLIFFEKFFKITTDLTLLELSNFDRPLLRELARKAPGTYSHSVTMGTIAESAAEAVEGNPLLARVGAYYHDVGKLITPEYFVENQLGQQNRHDQLSPKESVKLIFDHVKKGIDLAKEYKLPPEIIDFIPTHHGESVISFFFEKAKKLYGEEKVNPDDYRYPGPKPFTKETGIVMLADSCESAVRSVADADPEKIENLISNLINAKIADHQLDNTPLTFSDITKIKQTFLTILLGQSHHRIRYPEQDKMEEQQDKEGDKKA
jgi:putative nucleotidyltransferase with HDIG domain